MRCVSGQEGAGLACVLGGSAKSAEVSTSACRPLLTPTRKKTLRLGASPIRLVSGAST